MQAATLYFGGGEACEFSAKLQAIECQSLLASSGRRARYV